MNYWKVNLTLHHGYQRFLLTNTVKAQTRAQAIELAVNVRLAGQYGGDLACITEHYLIDGELIPAVFEFTYESSAWADWLNYDRYYLDDEITKEDLDTAVRVVSEDEYMRLIDAPRLIEVSE